MKKSGLASAALLAREGAEVRATDLKPLDELPGVRELDIPFAQQTPAVFEGADLIVLSPDVPADLAPLEEARRRGVPVIGEVELAAPFLKGRTIGITGSNGKTTTTSLIGHILREAGVPVQVGGNIGMPVTAMIETSRDDGWNVLELSSFQLETISEFRAHIATGAQRDAESPRPPPHLRELRRRQGPPLRDPAPRRLRGAQCRRSRLRVLRGTHRRHAAVVQQPQEGGARRTLCGDKLVLDGKLLMQAGEIPIRGRHNVENVLAASIAAARAGVSREAIAAAVRTFQAVEHRLEFVRAVSGVDFYNDSKATSVDATLKGARRLSRRPLGDSRRQGQGPRLHRAARTARPRRRTPRC